MNMLLVLTGFFILQIFFLSQCTLYACTFSLEFLFKRKNAGKMAELTT